MANGNQLIRVSAIKVTGLFGIYAHSVPLNADERVTIIHGPNGVGKTVFLKLTFALIAGKYSEFQKVPFDAFEMLFSDGSKVELFREANSGKVSLNLTFTDANGACEVTALDGDFLNPIGWATQVAEHSPYVMQIGPDEFVDRRSEEVIDASEVVARYGDAVSPKVRGKWSTKEPAAFKKVRERAKAHLIQAQRLIRFNASSEWRYRNGSPDRLAVETVQEYSRDLKRSVESTLAAYAKQSQKLDQTFPQRLLESTSPPLPLDALKTQMVEIEAERDRLKRIGLLDIESTQEAYPFQVSQLDNLQPAQVAVMTVYANDTREKLAVLTELARRVELLLTIVNRKFRNKRITVARDAGLVAIGADGQHRLPLTSLSSGEQHELVLLYDLLFKVKPNTLVLIDEPELSLHVTWQESFLSDLQEIIRVSQFDVLLATHSPYIVGDRSDLMVVLSSDKQLDSQK